MFHLRNFTIKIYKKHKSNYDLLALVIFPNLEIIQFWSVNYMSQVYKLYFLFWTFLKAWAIFMFQYFSKQSILLVAFVKYAS